MQQRRNPRTGTRSAFGETFAQLCKAVIGQPGIARCCRCQGGKPQVLPCIARVDRCGASGSKARQLRIAGHIGRTRQRGQSAGIAGANQHRLRKMGQCIVIAPAIERRPSGHGSRPVLSRLGAQGEIISRQSHVQRDRIALAVKMVGHRQQRVGGAVARFAGR